MAIEFYKEQDCVFVCDNHIPFDTKQMRGDEGTKDILQNEIIKFLNLIIQYLPVRLKKGLVLSIKHYGILKEKKVCY